MATLSSDVRRDIQIFIAAIVFLVSCILSHRVAGLDASLVLGAVAPLTLKRASASRPSGQWRDDDYDVLRERHRHWSHLIFTRRAAGPPLDVGERTFGDNSSASGARLRADARGGDGGVREELETRMMIKSPLPESVALLEKVHECLGPNRLPLLIAIDGADGVGKLDRIGELRRRMPIAARLPLTMTRALRIVA